MKPLAFSLALVTLHLAWVGCDETPTMPGLTSDPDTRDAADRVETASDVLAPDAPEPDAVALDATPTDTELATDALVHDVADVAVEVDPTPTTWELSMRSWVMHPGAESTKCVLLRLDNPEPIRVNRIRTNLGRGSHHLIIYRSNATLAQPDPYPCSPFTELLMGPTVPLAITQLREETITLPDGVAHELAAHQMFRLEVHHLNYFPADITTDVKVWFDAVSPDEPTEKADIMFYGNINIDVPKGKTVTSPWKQLDVPVGLKVFSLTGHTHSLGTQFEVERSTSASAPGPRVYPPSGAPFTWSEAPTAIFEPPLVFTELGDGFRFRCTWVNGTDADVSFGESANAEMCFFWAYYWPSQGPIVRFD